MDNSLKIGAVSGLIAGIVFTIVSEIFHNMRLSIGLLEPWQRPFFENNTLVNIPLFIFWGIILGIIYSKVHSLILGKGVLKGLIYGLFLFVIITIKIETYLISYGYFLSTLGHLFWGFFVYIAYGLSLGFVYKFLRDRYFAIKEEPKIVTYDVKSGFYPGAIAGLFCGLNSGIVSVLGHLTGQWGVITGGEIVNTIEFWYSQFGHHVLINMIWGIIFGLMYPKVYNIVPGKKFTKGVCYALILYLITTFQINTWFVVWYANHNAWQLALISVLNIIAYGLSWTIYGLVLGYLYRKPSD